MALASLKSILLMLVVFSQASLGTQYIPIPLIEQLNESDGVVRAKFVSKGFKKLPTGEVVTDNTFEVVSSFKDEGFGLANKRHLVITTPGGSWQGHTYRVSGLREFGDGDDYLLILKKAPFGLVVHNLALGMYRIEKKDGEEVLVNEAFPGNENLSNLSLGKFNRLLSREFGEKLNPIRKDTYVRNRSSERNSRKGKRAPASLESDEGTEEEGERMNSLFWLTFLLVGLSFLFSYGKRRQG